MQKFVFWQKVYYMLDNYPNEGSRGTGWTAHSLKRPHTPHPTQIKLSSISPIPDFFRKNGIPYMTRKLFASRTSKLYISLT